MISTDLRTTRIRKGLRVEDLASGMLRAATISEIERGMRLPRPKTRQKIESIIGPVDWHKTLAGSERNHLMFALNQFINSEGEGDAKSKIKFAKQALKLFENSL